LQTLGRIDARWHVARNERRECWEVPVRRESHFTGGEWSLTATHQPPVIPDEGEWHVRGDKLVLHFRGDAHDSKRSELVFTVRDDDHIVLRQPSGLETTLERLK